MHRYVCPELDGYQVTNDGALFTTRFFSEDTIERNSAASIMSIVSCCDHLGTRSYREHQILVVSSRA